jgi:hypothetical protein
VPHDARLGLRAGTSGVEALEREEDDEPSAKPVARTPNTPEARSPSVKRLPSGAPRRTKSIAAIATAATTMTMTMPQTMGHRRWNRTSASRGRL